jgi:hypothetical protein
MLYLLSFGLFAVGFNFLFYKVDHVIVQVDFPLLLMNCAELCASAAFQLAQNIFLCALCVQMRNLFRPAVWYIRRL